MTSTSERPSSGNEPPQAEIVPAGGELVRAARRSEVLRPLDPGALVGSFRAYQELLPRLLDSSDWQDAGGRRFVTKSGWRKIATAFDLDVHIIGSDVDRDEHGHAVRAKVIARAIAPSGRSMDGDGYCSADEARFTSSRADLSRVENDLRTTATTRAKNRAIADLVGMGEISAEESSAAVPFGPQVPESIKRDAAQACVILCGDDRDAGIELWQRISRELGGYMPHAAAAALILAARTVAPEIS